MNIKQLKKLIADMPDDAPVLIEGNAHIFSYAYLFDTSALYHQRSNHYEEFIGNWQLHEPGAEKVVALCLY